MCRWWLRIYVLRTNLWLWGHEQLVAAAICAIFAHASGRKQRPCVPPVHMLYILCYFNNMAKFIRCLIAHKPNRRDGGTRRTSEEEPESTLVNAFRRAQWLDNMRSQFESHVHNVLLTDTHTHSYTERHWQVYVLAIGNAKHFTVLWPALMIAAFLHNKAIPIADWSSNGKGNSWA